MAYLLFLPNMVAEGGFGFCTALILLIFLCGEMRIAGLQQRCSVAAGIRDFGCTNDTMIYIAMNMDSEYYSRH